MERGEITALDPETVMEENAHDIAKLVLNGQHNGDTYIQRTTEQNGNNGMHDQSRQSLSVVSE